MNCHACGTALSTNARFCHKCGAAVGTAQPTGWRTGVPWALAGAALGALVAVLAMRGSGGGGGQSGSPSSPPPASGSQLVAPDISQMSPEERANRLFDRIMIYAEAGKMDSVRFFLPMAMGAYSQLPTLDIDARYHIGLLHLAGGDNAAALAQADTIQKAAPTHLFAFILRAHTGDRRAYAAFLRNEAAELARNRPEYAEHRNALTAFKAEAERQTRVGA